MYDADEDWRAKDDADEAELDNFATSAKDDDTDLTPDDLGDDET